jgi:hypothetical protein
MTHRCHSLDDALAELAARAPARSARIVVSWSWWDALSEPERQAYRSRCDQCGVRLSADHRISRHFVEVVGDDEPPLSSEYRT